MVTKCLFNIVKPVEAELVYNEILPTEEISLSYQKQHSIIMTDNVPAVFFFSLINTFNISDDVELNATIQLNTELR